MKKILTGVIISVLIMPISLFSYEIEKNPSMPVEKSFIVGPAKIEATVPEGNSKTVHLNLENRTGQKETFKISFDDFTSGKEEGETVSIGNEDTSKTSLRSFLFVEKEEFVLDHGDRLLLPVTISIPAGTSPGTRLGAVLVSSAHMTDRITDDNRAYSATNVVGRVATLFFVNIPGEVNTSGKLETIKTKNNSQIFFSTPITLQILYRNLGDVYLNPYGKIDVKNMFGKQVSSYILDPWFTLPKSLRTREITLEKSLVFGKYTALASVNRGYDDIVDEMEVAFYVIPPISIVFLVIVLALLVMFLRKRSIDNTLV